MKPVKTFSYSSQALDISSLVGIAAGVGMLLSASTLTGMEMLALPALALLLPSLLWSVR
jgi:hypothetical protein